MKFDNIIKDDMEKEAEGGNGGNKWEMVKNLPNLPYFWPIHNHEGKCLIFNLSIDFRVS